MSELIYNPYWLALGTILFLGTITVCVVGFMTADSFEADEEEDLLIDRNQYEVIVRKAGM